MERTETTTATDPVVLASLKAGFEAALPMIQERAGAFFHYLDREKREDRVEDVVALAWKRYLREHERGNNPDDLIEQIAAFSMKQVRAGRRLTGNERRKDVLSRRHGHRVEEIPLTDETQQRPDLLDALADNRRMTPADGAAFKIDFQDWRKDLRERDQAIVDDLAAGATPDDVREKYNISRPRITQIRKRLDKDWKEFEGEERGR